MIAIIIKYKTTILLLLLLAATNSFAQSNTIEFAVNGLKVILRQTQKETLIMSMYFRGGSSNYSAANAGIESLALSGIVECGTSKYSANDFNDQIDEYGLHVNETADNDYGVLKFGCISRYKDEAWKLFSSAIASPVFEAQKLNLLKDQKISGLQLKLSDADTRLQRLAQEFAFANTPYAINPEGTAISLAALTRDAVKDYYYNTLLNRNRMFLVVAGNISKTDLEAKIKTDFAEIPTKPYVPATLKSPMFVSDNYTMEERAVATNYLCGIVNAPDLSSNDYPAFRVAITILNSVLFDVIRISKHLSYAPSASLSLGKISYATMYASTSQPKETIKAMYSSLSSSITNTFTDKTIESVQKGLISSYVKRQEMMSDNVDQLGEAEILGDWKLAEATPARISTVTARDVSVVLRHYARYINWAYIGNTGLGKESFER